MGRPVSDCAPRRRRTSRLLEHVRADATRLQEVIETTRRHNRELDERCAQLGRDPAQLRRSLVLWAPLDPWATPDAFERIVDSFRDTGIAEFIVMWPPEHRLPLLERAAATIGSLREREAH